MPCPNSARQRRVTVSFRCTPEQSESIDRLVAMSGMAKQDYIVSRLEECAIDAVPSTRLYKGLADAAKSVYLELRRLHDASQMDERTLAVMESFAGVLRDLGEYDEDEVSDSTREDRGIMDMERG